MAAACGVPGHEDGPKVPPAQGTSTTQLRLLTFNVNGLRPCSTKFGGLTKLLDHLNADIICFQEHKLRKCDLDSDLGVAEGWDSYFSFTRGKTGYSGVATFCRKSVSVPCHAEEGLAGIINMQPAHRAQVLADPLWSNTGLTVEQLLAIESEGRVLLTDHGAFVLINMYGVAITNEEKAEERRALKMNMYKALEARVRALLAVGKRVLVVGDFNICPRPIDHRDPEPDDEWFSSPPDVSPTSWLWHFSWDGPQEGPIVDTFRMFHPTRTKAFTCWKLASGARQHNWGSRIDLILAAGPGLHAGVQARDAVSAWVVDGDIWPDLQGSDHAPAWVTLAFSEPLPTQLPNPPPVCCTRAILQPAKQSRLTGWLGMVGRVSQEHAEAAAGGNGMLAATLPGEREVLTAAAAAACSTEMQASSIDNNNPVIASSSQAGVQDSKRAEQLTDVMPQDTPASLTMSQVSPSAAVGAGLYTPSQQVLPLQPVTGMSSIAASQQAASRNVTILGLQDAAGFEPRADTAGTGVRTDAAGSGKLGGTKSAKAGMGLAGGGRSGSGGMKKGGGVQPKLSAYLKPLNRAQPSSQTGAGTLTGSQGTQEQPTGSTQQHSLRSTASCPTMQALFSKPSVARCSAARDLQPYAAHAPVGPPGQPELRSADPRSGQSTPGASRLAEPHIVLLPPAASGLRLDNTFAGVASGPIAPATGETMAFEADGNIGADMSSGGCSIPAQQAACQRGLDASTAALQGRSSPLATQGAPVTSTAVTADVEHLDARPGSSQEAADIERDRQLAMELANSQQDPTTRRGSGPLSEAAQAWKALFVPTQPPPCHHKEPSVLRTVKKGGPNDGRTFYVCARAEGPPPEGRCDFFQWADKRVTPGGQRGRGQGSKGSGVQGGIGARAGAGLFRVSSGAGALPGQQPASKKPKLHN